MQIKSSDAAPQARPSSIRPAAVSLLTPEAPSSLINLSISSEVRVLSTLLSQALPALGTLHLLDVLTPADRLMLARAVQFAASEGIALDEVRKLVIDLGLHRLELNRPAASAPGDSQPARERAENASHPSATHAPVRVAPAVAAPVAGAPDLPTVAVPAALSPARAALPSSALGPRLDPLAYAATSVPSALLSLTSELAAHAEPGSQLEMALLDPLRESSDSTLHTPSAAAPADFLPPVPRPQPTISAQGAIATDLGALLRLNLDAPATDAVQVGDVQVDARDTASRQARPSLPFAFAPEPRSTQASPPHQEPRQGALASSLTSATDAGRADVTVSGALLAAPTRATLGAEPARSPLERVLAPALAAPEPSASDEPRASAVLRSLPLFTPRDELLARTILGTLALHDTLVDPHFVRSLLDPDRRPDHAVDFGFLRRLVIALSASHTDGATDPRVSGERREARAGLALAVANLGEALGPLPALAELDLAQGAARLRERWPVRTEVVPPGRPDAAGSTAAALDPAQHESAPATPLVNQAHPRLPSVPDIPRADRALLGLLYAAAKSEPDLERVDRVALALRALRAAERREPLAFSAVRPLRPSVAPAAAMTARATERAQHHPESAQRKALGPSDATPVQGPPPEASVQMPQAELASHGHVRLERADVLSPWPPSGPEPRREERPVPEAGGTSHPAASEPAPRQDVQGQEASRSFGSASQLAARVAGSYARIASESTFPSALNARGVGVPGLTQGAPHSAPLAGVDAGRELAPMPTLTRPLNAAEALGISGLVRELKTRALRSARLRKRHMGRGDVRPLEALREAGYDAEADDPVLDAAPRRRRVRWHLLLERRKRRRTKER